MIAQRDNELFNIYYMKKCNKCLLEKEINLFPKTGAKCKECMAEYKKEYALLNKVIFNLFFGKIIFQKAINGKINHHPTSVPY